MEDQVDKATTITIELDGGDGAFENHKASRNRKVKPIVSQWRWVGTSSSQELTRNLELVTRAQNV